MRILQLMVDYFYTDLYRNYIQELSKEHVTSISIVPTVQGDTNHEDGVVTLPCYTKIDRLVYFPKQRKMYDAICRIDDIENIDCIHAHTLFSTGLVALRMFNKYKTPYIVAVRNTDVNLFMKYFFFLRFLWNRIMNNATYVVFISPAYRNKVIEKYVNKKIKDSIIAKSIVIPNGIDDSFFETRGTPRVFNKESINLIYVGRLDKNKNLELTIAAVNELNKKGKSVTLQVVGGIVDEKYRAMVLSNPNIRYHEKCDKKMVREFLDKADIFVMPSHYETFGLVYVEAMSRGTPIIYTRGQGFDGFFADGVVGYATSDTDSKELVNNIERIVDDYEQLSINCLKEAGAFSWTKIAQQYKGIYTDTVRKVLEKENEE